MTEKGEKAAVEAEMQAEEFRHSHEHAHYHTHEHTHEAGTDHDHDHGHVHGHAHDHDHEHDHDHCHAHGHGHTHPHRQVVVNRLAKAEGHLRSVKKMVENERDCSEVLIQLSAVIAALNNAGKIILEDHIENCIVDAVQNEDQKPIDDLMKAIEQFVK